MGTFAYIKKYGFVLLVWWTVIDVILMSIMVYVLQYDIFPYDAMFLANKIGFTYDFESSKSIVLQWGDHQVALTPRLVANCAVSYALLEVATPVLLPIVIATLPVFLRAIGRKPTV